MAEHQPVSHEELVSTTATLCLKILANPVASAKEKTDLTQVLMQTTGCQPAEVLVSMEKQIKAKARIKATDESSRGN